MEIIKKVEDYNSINSVIYYALLSGDDNIFFKVKTFEYVKEAHYKIADNKTITALKKMKDDDFKKLIILHILNN